MIPLSTLVTITAKCRARRSPPASTCSARWRSAGCPARGYTSGQALAALEDVFAKTMPKEMGFAYSSLSYQEKVAPPAGPTFILAIVFVFLLLAAMYESWRLPWAVLLGSPLVALGAFFGVWLDGLRQQRLRPDRPHHAHRSRRQERDPDRRVRQGEARRRASRSQEAALESARLRFRPILMTAFAFILGVVPLMLASGAGPGAQNVMGTAVFWGMLVATFLGVFIIPGNFAFVERLGGATGGRSGPRRAPCPSRRRADAPGGASVRRAAPAGAGGARCSPRCTVGPDYRRPEVSLPPCSAALDPAAPGGPGSLGDVAWWDDLRGRGPPDADPDRAGRELRPAARRGAHPGRARPGGRSPGRSSSPTVDGSARRPVLGHRRAIRPPLVHARELVPPAGQASTSPSSSTSGAAGVGPPRPPAPSCSQPRKAATWS